MTEDKDRLIAIVGVSAVLPDAPTAADFWSNVKLGRYSIRDVPPDRWDLETFYDPDPRAPDKTYSKIGGWVTEWEWDPLAWRLPIPPRVAESMDRTQKWAVAATRQLLAGYGYPERPLDSRRTAVILGNAMAGDRHYLTALRVYFPEFVADLERIESFAQLPADVRRTITAELRERSGSRLPEVTEDTMPGELANIIAGRVANLFDFHGPNYIVDAACASAMAAIGAAVEGLAEHDFDTVITGGVDANMSAATFTKFCKIGALSATGTRPYADGADGFVMGEGAALFLLKRLDDALRDGDVVHALIRGVGGSSDGRGKGITAPNPLGQRIAVERAWRRAGLCPDSATLIEGHGTSTPVGDVVEVESLIEAFRPFDLAAGSVPLGSVKSNIGHLKGAAGAAGVLKAVFALHEKVLPPSLGCERPNPKIDFARCPFHVQTRLEEWGVDAGATRRAGVSAFGFGGTNFHLVLEEFLPERPPEPRRARIALGEPTGRAPRAGGARAPLRGAVLIGAAGEQDLAEKLRALAAEARSCRAPDLAAPSEVDLGAPVRVAIDYADAPELAKKAARALGVLEGGRSEAWPALRGRGVFYGRGPAPGIAMLFTGQGSQYLDMLRELRDHDAVVARTIAEADAVMAPLLGRPLSEFVFVDSDDPAVIAEAEGTLRQTAITQPAVLTVDVALARLLGAYGIAPDFVMGHSLGEYAALVVAGALDFGAALEAVSARGRAMMDLHVEDNGTMAAVFAPLAEIERILGDIDGYVVVANINSPGEAVIGGATVAMEKAVAALGGAGYDARALPVSHAFHTEIVAPVSAPLREVLEQLHLQPPSLPIVANVSGEFYPMGPGVELDMIDILSRQVAQPVQFVRGLQTLYHAGARLFVEVGPKRALQGMVRSVFEERDDVLDLSTNHPRLGDVASFNQALCGLWAAGLGVGADMQQGAEARIARSSPAEPRSPGSRGVVPPSAAEEVGTAGGGAASTPPRATLDSRTYLELGQLFAEVLERGIEVYSGGRPEVSEKPVVITGASLGLPGTERVFDDGNVERLLTGQQFIREIPQALRQAMVDKRITRLVKSDRGGPRFERIQETSEVIKLAARAGRLDLVEEFGFPADRAAALDVVSELAIGAGLDALRDAGIPLIRRYKTTTKGTRLPDAWGLPSELRDDTGVIFASAFPGIDFFADEAERYYRDRARRDRLAELESLRSELEEIGEPAARAALDQRIDRIRDEVEKTAYTFERRFLFRLLAMGHSQFAELIGARGPNTQINAACASGTQALSLAEDWIRAGRCNRVIVISADNVTSDRLLEWIGAGFLATGAAATDDEVADAAIPFDRRRHGMIIGMGAAALVVEDRESVAARGLQPICEVLGTVTANSAFHGTRLDIEHISQVMESLLQQVERRWGVDRQALAAETVFISHETYTPARGGSAQAEIFALRRAFGPAADQIVIANTKGYTGHPMAVAMEEVLAVKSLETGIVPPVANFREIDPELGLLNLARGGYYPVRYALRLGAGFGSQISMSLLRWEPPSRGRRPTPSELGPAFRIVDPQRWQGWLDRISGFTSAELEVDHRTLRIRDQGPPAGRPAVIAAAGEPSPPAAPPGSPSPAAAATAPPPAAVGTAPPSAAEATAPRATVVDAVAERVLAIVSEMTGYPEDMLDLDLDMEADLGIDTVKQAEMFAAIRQEWDIPRDDSLQLRDFPTLADAIRFVYERRPELGAPSPAAPGSPPLPAAGSVPPPAAEATAPPTAAVGTAPPPAAEATSAPSVTAETGEAAGHGGGAVDTNSLDRPKGGEVAGPGSILRRVPVAAPRPPLELCKPTEVERLTGKRIVLMPDEGGVGVALARHLDRLGVEVLLLEGVPETVEVVARLEAWLEAGPVDGVYWLPALDLEESLDRMSENQWAKGLRIRVKLLFVAMRVLYEAISRPGDFLVAGTRFGGRHGYDTAGASAPMGGAVSGFVKAYKRERPDALVKVVDFGSETGSAEVAQTLLDETLRDPGVVEVGIQDGLRWTVSLEKRALEAVGATAEPFGHEPVVVVTGAAGSIVSAVVSDLAACWPGHYYLLDLTPEPDPADRDLQLYRRDRETLRRRLFERLAERGERATPARVEQQLAALERAEAATVALANVARAGGTGHYRSLNLLDGEAVAGVVDEIRRRHDRIDLLIHAAGAEISHRLPDKSEREFDLVFEVKSRGWFHLLRAVGEMPLGAVLVFSSIAGRFGNAGQSDYCAGNDLLCKLTSNLKSTRPETRGIAIDWTAWSELGMASRGSIPKMMALAGIEMLSPTVAIPVVRRELAAGFRGEVVIAGGLGALLEEWDEAGGLDTAAIEEGARGPMISRFERLSLYEGLAAEITLDPSVQPFLDDHRIDGTAVLPGVMGIEGFAELAKAAFPSWHVVSVEEVEFLTPFKFYRDEPRVVVLQATWERSAEDLVACCRLVGSRRLSRNVEARETIHFTGKVRLARGSLPPPTAAIPPPPKEATLQQNAIYALYFHGPAYRVVGEAWRSGDRLVGRYADALPPNHRPAELRTLTMPRLVELCFQTAGLLEMTTSGGVGLPSRLESLRIHEIDSPTPGGCLAVATRRSDALYDALVVDDDERVLLEVTGYRTVQAPLPLELSRVEEVRRVLRAETGRAGSVGGT